MGSIAYVFSLMKYLSCTVRKYSEKYEVTLDGVDQGTVISQFMAVGTAMYATTSMNQPSFIAYWSTLDKPISMKSLLDTK